MRIPSSPYLLLVITMLFWAGNFVVGRFVHGNIPPISMGFWRILVTTAVLLPLAGREVWVERAVFLHHWRLMTVLAAVGIAIYHASVYTALSLTTAINVSLVFAITPVVIPMMSYLLDRERVSWRQMAGIALSLGGVVAIITRADAAALLGLRFNAGDLWMVLGMAVWALFAVLLQRCPARVSALGLLLVISALGTLMLAPVYAWELAALGGFAVDPVNMSSIAFVVVSGVIALALWNRAVVEVGPTKAGLFTHLTPVFAIVLAIVLLGETLQLYHVGGSTFIVLGIFLTITAPRTRRAPSATTQEPAPLARRRPRSPVEPAAAMAPAAEPLDRLARLRPRPHSGATQEPAPLARLRPRSPVEPTAAPMESPVDPPPKPEPEPEPKIAPKSEIKAAPAPEPEPRADSEDGEVLQLTPKMSFSPGSRVVSAPTSSQSADVLAALASAHNARRDLPMGARGATFEGVIKELLRSMLTEWLEHNLPALMERLVKKELDFMVRRGRAEDLMELERRKASPRSGDAG